MILLMVYSAHYKHFLCFARDGFAPPIGHSLGTISSLHVRHYKEEKKKKKKATRAISCERWTCVISF